MSDTGLNVMVELGALNSNGKGPGSSQRPESLRWAALCWFGPAPSGSTLANLPAPLSISERGQPCPGSWGWFGAGCSWFSLSRTGVYKHQPHDFPESHSSQCPLNKLVFTSISRNWTLLLTKNFYWQASKSTVQIGGENNLWKMPLLAVVAQACKPCPQEPKAGGLQVEDLSEQHPFENIL